MKPSVERALALLDRRSFSGVEDFQRFREFCIPIGFNRLGQADFWTEDDDGFIRHYLLTVDKTGDVMIEDIEIKEEDL